MKQNTVKKTNFKKLFKLGLVGTMSLASILGIFAEEVKGTVIDKVEGRMGMLGLPENIFYIDEDDDGFADWMMHFGLGGSSDIVEARIRKGDTLTFDNKNAMGSMIMAAALISINDRPLADILKNWDPKTFKAFFPDAFEARQRGQR
jgi:hypothetical protein